MELFLPDSEATERLGKLLGSLAKNGDVICFTGDLGAGKTLMSRGIAVGMGADAENVNSPTFTIMNVYDGSELEIRHFDLYRLNRAEELDDIGFDEYCGGSGVTLVEWAELFEEKLPEEYLQVTLLHHEGGRKVILTPKGKRYEKMIEGVKNSADFGH